MSNINVENVMMVAKKSAIISEMKIPLIPKNIGKIKASGIKMIIFLKMAIDKETKACPKAIKVVWVASCKPNTAMPKKKILIIDGAFSKICGSLLNIDAI